MCRGDNVGTVHLKYSNYSLAKKLVLYIDLRKKNSQQSPRRGTCCDTRVISNRFEVSDSNRFDDLPKIQGDIKCEPILCRWFVQTDLIPWLAVYQWSPANMLPVSPKGNCMRKLRYGHPVSTHYSTLSDGLCFTVSRTTTGHSSAGYPLSYTFFWGTWGHCPAKD